MQSYRTCVVGDPSSLVSVEDVRNAVNCEAGCFPNRFVVNISADLYEKLRAADATTDYEVHSDVCDESFFAVGDTSGIKGLFAISHDPFVNPVNGDAPSTEHGDRLASSNPKVEDEWNVDWEDYMMTILNDPTLQVDQESFPLYLMFGRIPEEDSVLSIFGIPSEDSLAFSALILRSRDCCSSSNSVL